MTLGKLFDRHTRKLHKLARIRIIIHSQLIVDLVAMFGRSESPNIRICELVYDWYPVTPIISINSGYVYAFVRLILRFNHSNVFLVFFSNFYF